MAAPGTAPCALWIDEADLCTPCDALYDLTRFTEMAEAASWVYFMLSGQQYNGGCTSTVRPCARSRGWRPQGGEYAANAGVLGLYDIGGSWATPMGWQSGWGSCDCNRDEQCGCGGLPQIELGGTPVASVDEVWVAGVKLRGSSDPNPQYRVDDYRYLVRLNEPDGTNPGWPCCQRLDLDPHNPANLETFEITYTWGEAPPAMGKMAAAELACELLQACQPEGKCKLPPRTVQAVRQGVTISVADLVSFLDKGQTGFRWGNLFLKAARSAGVQGADVFSPDLPRGDRRVGT